MTAPTIERELVTGPLETPERSVEKEGANPPLFHYVRKGEILQSAVMGDHVVALCGEQFPVTRRPKQGAHVCPDCRDIYENMRP